MDCIYIEARDLCEAWYLSLVAVLEKGRKYVIDRGSYEGQQRLELDYVTIRIKYPGTRPLLPQIPPYLGIPSPVDEAYLEKYLAYLLTAEKEDNELYTYGTYLEYQIPEVIRMYREDGHNTNQAFMTIGEPGTLFLKDPPCLRGIDARIKDGKLHFIIYFRSNDLWGAYPANLAALQLLKEYMANEIGVDDGEMIYSSKGLHLYDYSWELAKIRTGQI